jgi:hypothetical protein
VDWLQFISSLASSLAWPIAAVVIAFMFREQLRETNQAHHHRRARCLVPARGVRGRVVRHVTVSNACGNPGRWLAVG